MNMNGTIFTLLFILHRLPPQSATHRYIIYITTHYSLLRFIPIQMEDDIFWGHT